MEYCNIFIAEYQYNQYNNNIIVPSADWLQSSYQIELFMYNAPSIKLRND